MNPVHTLTSVYLRSVLILCSHLCLDVFPSGFPVKILYDFLILPMCATFSARLFLVLIILLFDEEYKL